MLVSLFHELPSIRLAASPSTPASVCVALARVYVSLYRLLGIEGRHPELGTAETYHALSAELFELICKRLSAERFELEEQALLTETLYELSRETDGAFRPVQVAACDKSVWRLMQAWEREGGGEQPNHPALPAVCQVLASYFYPETEEGDAWFGFLSATWRRWGDALAAEGTWIGVSPSQVWSRLSLLNRYSYLFRQHQYDAEAVRACHCYQKSLLLAPPSVELLGSYLDACLPGHLYASSDQMLSRVVKTLLAQADVFPLHSNARLQGLSYAIKGMCALRLRQEAKRCFEMLVS